MPTFGAKQHAVPSGRPGDVEDIQFRPFEFCARCRQRFSCQALVHFRNIQDRVARIDVLEVVHNAALNKGGSLIIYEFLIDDARKSICPDFW